MLDYGFGVLLKVALAKNLVEFINFEEFWMK